MDLFQQAPQAQGKLFSNFEFVRSLLVLPLNQHAFLC